MKSKVKYLLIGFVVIFIGVICYFLFFPVFETDNFTPDEPYVTTRSIYKRINSSEFLSQYKIERKVVMNDTLMMLMLSNSKGFYRLNVTRSEADKKSVPEKLIEEGDTINVFSIKTYSDYKPEEDVSSNLDSLYTFELDYDSQPLRFSMGNATILPVTFKLFVIVPKEPNYNTPFVDSSTSASKQVAMDIEPVPTGFLRDNCLFLSSDADNGLLVDGLIYNDSLSQEVVYFSKNRQLENVDRKVTIPIKYTIETSRSSFDNYYEISYILPFSSSDMNDCSCVYLTGDTSVYFSRDEIKKEMASRKLHDIRGQIQDIMYWHSYEDFERRALEIVKSELEDMQNRCMSMDDLYKAFRNRTTAYDLYVGKKVLFQMKVEEVNRANGIFDPRGFAYKLESTKSCFLGEWIGGYDVKAYTNDADLGNINPPIVVCMEGILTSQYGCSFTFKNCTTLYNSDDVKFSVTKMRINDKVFVDLSIPNDR